MVNIAPLPPSSAEAFLPMSPIEPPVVEAPSLDDLNVEVVVRSTVTENDLLTRFHALKRSVSTKTRRRQGEKTVMGDEVVLNVVGMRKGVILPFSFRQALSLDLAPESFLPGVALVLAGEKVGARVAVGLQLPGDYPVVGLRNQKVDYIFEIVGASAVNELDDESPQLLKRLKRGSTLKEVFTGIRQELIDEAAAAAALEGQNLVLDKLIRRVKLKIPGELIDAEIRHDWRRLEGEAMRAMGFKTDALDVALHGWLVNVGLREQAERRIKLAAVLRAINVAEQWDLTPEALLTFVHQRVLPGLTPKEVAQALQEDAERASQIVRVVAHLITVERIMQRAKVTYRAA